MVHLLNMRLNKDDVVNNYLCMIDSEFKNEITD